METVRTRKAGNATVSVRGDVCCNTFGTAFRAGVVTPQFSFKTGAGDYVARTNVAAMATTHDAAPWLALAAMAAQQLNLQGMSVSHWEQ